MGPVEVSSKKDIGKLESILKPNSNKRDRLIELNKEVEEHSES